jgi:hypothetical protein
MLTVSKGDYGYTITDTLENADGSPFDLSGYSVAFHVWRSNSPGTLLVNGVATIILPASAGTVSYTVAPGDFTEVGIFKQEWEATTVGDKQSFPTIGNTIFVVEST